MWVLLPFPAAKQRTGCPVPLQPGGSQRRRLPQDSPSRCEGVGERPHLRVIYMLCPFAWQPPMPSGPSLPVCLLSLLPLGSRTPARGAQPLTCLETLSLRRWPGEGTARVWQEEDSAGCSEGPQPDCGSGWAAERGGWPGGEGRRGAGGRKGVGPRALAQAGSFDKETGSRGKGDAECPGGKLRGGWDHGGRAAVDPRQPGPEQREAERGEGRSCGQSLLCPAPAGRPWVLLFPGLSSPICKVGLWR